jgi:pilus assembly protein Flp/PilA
MNFNQLAFLKHWKEILEAIKNLWQDQSGANAMEYTLLVALIAAVILGVVSILGQAISNIFTNDSRNFMQTLAS